MTALFTINNGHMICQGEWTKWQIVKIQNQLLQYDFNASISLVVDGSQVSHIDSAGAILLLKILKPLLDNQRVTWRGFTEAQQALIDLLLTQNLAAYQPAQKSDSHLTVIGKSAVSTGQELQQFLMYIGENSLLFLNCFLGRTRIRWRMLANGIQVTGYNAMPIVGLLSFLIGVVLAYQLGNQLTNYGANIYVVDIAGMAILREFAPLITAIILAGRTGSAYAAQIGAMVLNKEVDAIRTLGLSAQEILVLPRIIALVISLPLLAVLADICGVLGSMFMSRLMLDVSYLDFIKRFGNVIELKMFLIGMIKTPVYALLIASIGCFHGLRISGGASSVGHRTTMSVVHGIFMIIVADAGFSVLFSGFGI